MESSEFCRETGLKTIRTAKNKFFAALAPREKWSPSEWAENCRELSPEETSEPGPYRFDRTPYWRFVNDLISRPGIEEIVCLKGAQIGWSDACRNAIGYWIDLHPGPCMILMPDEKSARDFADERLSPLVENTEAVRRHMTGRAWDKTKRRVRFDNMSLFLTWAGSKTGTKSRPIRYLVCEEPDEYPSFSSTGGDPLAKAEKRITTYADKGLARVLIGGTPTTRRGNVWKRWELCPVRYHFWLPCPHCSGYQLLLWKQVKWPDLSDEPDRAKRAAKVESDSLAFYECEHCKKPIRDHHKPRMLRRGIWATEDQAVTADGRVVGPEPKGKRVGVKISGLYSPWVTFGKLAKEWIESQGDTQALCDFVNQRLAEAFEEERQKTEPTLIESKAKGAPAPGIVPIWATTLIATADTQGVDELTGHFWYVVRAWGHEYRSQLIGYGLCRSKEELKTQTIDRTFETEDSQLVTPNMLLIDTGGPRWNEIYQFSLTDNRIHPAKGSAHSRTWPVTERPQKRHQVVLWEIDTEQSKDLLHRLIHSPDATLWLPHNSIGPEYAQQMCSESKVFNPRENREEWVEIVKNNNHLWDCEHMQAAAAWRMGCATVARDPEQKSWFAARKR